MIALTLVGFPSRTGTALLRRRLTMQSCLVRAHARAIAGSPGSASATQSYSYRKGGSMSSIVLVGRIASFDDGLRTNP